MSFKGAPLYLCDLCRVKYATFHDTYKLCDGCYVKDTPGLPEKIKEKLLARDSLTPKLDIEFTRRIWSISPRSKNTNKTRKTDGT